MTVGDLLCEIHGPRREVRSTTRPNCIRAPWCTAASRTAGTRGQRSGVALRKPCALGEEERSVSAHRQDGAVKAQQEESKRTGRGQQQDEVLIL